MDSALSIPQGSQNNSAGESLPTLRSSFRVGVTEDRTENVDEPWRIRTPISTTFWGRPRPRPFPDQSRRPQTAERHPRLNDRSMTESGGSGSVIETDNGYFAVFDGHAGTFAAEWCGKKLHLILEDIMKKNPNTPVPELLDQAFTSVDQQLEKLPVKQWLHCRRRCPPLGRPNTILPRLMALVPAVPATASESEAVPEHAQTPTQPEQNATPANPPPEKALHRRRRPQPICGYYTRPMLAMPELSFVAMAKRFACPTTTRGVMRTKARGLPMREA